MSIKAIAIQGYQVENNCLVVSLSNGYKVHFQTNAQEVFHVVFEKPSGLTMPKTWQIAPGLTDLPDDGLDRLNIPGFSAEAFSIVDNIHTLVLSTNTIQIIMTKSAFHLTWQYNNDGTWVTFMQDRPSQPYYFYQTHAPNIRHYMARPKEDEFFGIGEKSGHLKRNGRRFRFLNIDAMGYDAETTDPLYKHIPFIITRNRQLGMSSGLFYDNLSESILDMGQEMDNYHGHYRYYEAMGGDLDFYVIACRQMREVTQLFSRLTGNTMMPPKWSLYYSGSTMAYTDADNAQEKLYSFLKDCQQYDIPCRSFQLSSGYTSIRNLRCVFNWNKEKFPDFKKLAKDFLENNIQFCANIKPALLTVHPMFDSLKEQGLFIKEADSDNPELFQFWDGLGAALDFTNPAAAAWWKSQVREKLLEYGITSTWNDNNEDEIWDGEARCDGFGKTIKMGEIRPLMALLMMRASYQAQKEFSPNKRPYLISRSGPIGLQRYAQTWSGDNYTDWKTLKFNSYMGLSLSLCGVYNFGHDIGGFSGPAPDPELLVRWMQHGIFWPRYTVHSWNDDGSVNVPWSYPSHLTYTQQALALRNRLIPTIYDLLYRAHTNYEAILKPLFYDFENDPGCKDVDDNFMMGNILAAPVIEQGAKVKQVYLPKGTSWYSGDGQKLYEGGNTVQLNVDIGSIPYFVRGGTVLGINNAASGFANLPEKRIFEIYPLTTGEFTQEFFEDDGESFDFEREGFIKYNFRVICDASSVQVTLKKTGNWVPEYSHIQLELPAADKRQLFCNSEQIEGTKTPIDLTKISLN